MGRTITPKYRVVTKTNYGYMTPSGWQGRPTVERLEAWRQDYNKSFLPGGTNAHLSTDGVFYITSAKIVRQTDDRVMAEVKMPMFEVM